MYISEFLFNYPMSLFKIPCNIIRSYSNLVLSHNRSISADVPTNSKIIYGKEMAKDLRKKLKTELKQWAEKGNRPPSLTAVLVGDDPASHSYVNIKMKASRKVGIEANVCHFPSSIEENNLLKEINSLNLNSDVDAILVQLPLPHHINERVICNAVSYHKDVDGFNVFNIGRLALNMECMIPCTALAVFHMIASTGIPVKGKTAVVCGRSKNVGLPISLLLHSQGSGELKGMNMTTSICHRHTPVEELSRLTRGADILVTATGVPGIIKADMVKPNACVIDVGITRVTQNGETKFIGDVDFDNVADVASYLTPVPGGVGPVTVSMLLKNTLKAAILNPLARIN